MKNFMNESFLLGNDVAEILYHMYAAKMPIIDYNSRLSAKDIAENKRYSNIWELCLPFLSNEKNIAAPSSDYEKFRDLCRKMPSLIGNPIYIIIHLALRRYFDCDLIINEKNCDEIWRITAKRLERPDMTAKKLIEDSNVKLLCTTLDPSDTLEYHAKIAKDESSSVKVLPTFCPDKSIAINCEGICDHLKVLGDANGTQIKDYESLKTAMTNALDRFHSLGCKSAKHTFDGVFTFIKPDEYHADLVLKKAIASNGKDVTPEEYNMFRSQVLYFFAEQYKKRGWVMQLNFSTFNTSLSLMLDYFGTYNALPRTLFCSADPYNVAALEELIEGCGPYLMQGITCRSCDCIDSLKARIKQLAASAPLGTHFGAINTAESVISFPTHEYFKRILCDVIGICVEDRLFPPDFEVLAQLVCDICYNNVKNFFEFDLK